MPLVLRNVKQTELTWAELDGNFTYLEDYIAQVEQQTGSNEIVRVIPQTFLPAEQDQARANINAASVDVTNDIENRLQFVEESLDVQENVFTHVITQPDVDAPTTFSVQLPNVPIPSSYNLLFIQGGFVNPTKYTVVNDVLSFDKADVYNLVLGKLITFIYRY